MLRKITITVPALCLLLTGCLATSKTVLAGDVAKELKKDWDAVISSYEKAPDSKETLDRIDGLAERWKDDRKYDSARARYLKGMIHYGNKHYSTAYKVFEELVDRYSWSPYADSAHYKMGECLYNQGKFSEAAEQWNKYRFKYSKSMFIMEAVYGISLSYLHLKEYKKADKVLSNFLSSNSHYAEDEKIKIVGGIIDFYLERYEDAAAKLKRIKSDVAYYYSGHSLVKIKKYLDASSAFKRIGERFPKSKYLESALYNKAEAFYKGENYSVAASDYLNFLKKFPGSNLAPYARFKRASALYMERQYEKAASNYKMVVDGAGNMRVRAYAAYLMAECKRKLKDYKGALASYNSVVKQFPDVHEVHSAAQLKSGWCNVVLKNYSKAEPMLTDYTQKYITHEDLPLGYYLLGTSYYMKKQYPTSVEMYKYLLDKFKYSDLTEGALLMTELAYYNQEQYGLLANEASHTLGILSSKFQSPKSKIRSRAYYYLGLAYFKGGMYGPASKAFREIVDKYYDSDIVDEARANLAWCYYELENYRGARTMAKDVISSPKIKKKVKKACEILIAHAYFSEKNYDKASYAYGDFAYNHGKDKDYKLVAEALFQQGKVYEIQEYYNDAIKAWQTLAGRYPKSERAPEAVYKMSDIYFKAQQFDKALAGFQQLLETWPKAEVAEDALLSVAEVYYNTGKESKAVETYKKFLKKYPDSTKITSVEEGMQRADYKKAEKKEDPEMLLAYYEKYPESSLAVDALYKSAEIFYQKSKFDEAISTFNKLIEEFPNDTLAVNAHYYLGACYEGLKKFDKAADAYKAFVKNYPKHELTSDVMFRLATAAYTNKNYSDSVFYYERIIEKYEGSEYAQNAMYNAALAYTELNRMDDAIRFYRKYAKEFPDDPKSKDIPLQVAGMYLEQKRYKDAIEAYKEVAEKSDGETRAEAYYRVGDIYSSLEDSEKAIEIFTNLLKAKPKSSVYRVTGLINLATIYEEKEKWVEAVNTYEAIAQSGGQKDYVDGAKSRISEIKRVYPDLFPKAAPKKSGKSAK